MTDPQLPHRHRNPEVSSLAQHVRENAVEPPADTPATSASEQPYQSPYGDQESAHVDSDFDPGPPLGFDAEGEPVPAPENPEDVVWDDLPHDARRVLTKDGDLATCSGGLWTIHKGTGAIQVGTGFFAHEYRPFRPAPED